MILPGSLVWQDRTSVVDFAFQSFEIRGIDHYSAALRYWSYSNRLMFTDFLIVNVGGFNVPKIVSYP